MGLAVSRLPEDSLATVPEYACWEEDCDVPPHTQIPIVAECVASLISHRMPGSHETRALHVRSWGVPDNRISQLVVYGTVGLRCRFCDMSVRLSRRCRIVCSFVSPVAHGVVCPMASLKLFLDLVPQRVCYQVGRRSVCELNVPCCPDQYLISFR